MSNSVAQYLGLSQSGKSVKVFVRRDLDDIYGVIGYMATEPFLGMRLMETIEIPEGWSCEARLDQGGNLMTYRNGEPLKFFVWNEDNLYLNNLKNKKTQIKLSVEVPNFHRIQSILEENNLSVFPTPLIDTCGDERLSLVFSLTEHLIFNDIYILVSFFRDFGLMQVIISNKTEEEVRVGKVSQNFEYNNFLTEPLPVDNFLLIPVNESNKDTILNKYFEVIKNYDEGAEISEVDWEKENWDALTDGQYGDYDGQQDYEDMLGY